jgi:hypothetical protein
MRTNCETDDQFPDGRDLIAVKRSERRGFDGGVAAFQIDRTLQVEAMT